MEIISINDGETEVQLIPELYHLVVNAKGRREKPIALAHVHIEFDSARLDSLTAEVFIQHTDLIIEACKRLGTKSISAYTLAPMARAIRMRYGDKVTIEGPYMHANGIQLEHIILDIS